MIIILQISLIHIILSILSNPVYPLVAYLSRMYTKLKGVFPAAIIISAILMFTRKQLVEFHIFRCPEKMLWKSYNLEVYQCVNLFFQILYIYKNIDFTNNYPQHNRISTCSENDNESKSNGEHRVRNNLGKIEL